MAAAVFQGVEYPTKRAMLRAMLETYYENLSKQEMIDLLGAEMPDDVAEAEADGMIEHWKLDQPTLFADGRSFPAHMDGVGYTREELVSALTDFWQAVASGIDPRFDE